MASLLVRRGPAEKGTPRPRAFTRRAVQSMIEKARSAPALERQGFLAEDAAGGGESGSPVSQSPSPAAVIRRRSSSMVTASRRSAPPPGPDTSAFSLMSRPVSFARRSMNEVEDDLDALEVEGMSDFVAVLVRHRPRRERPGWLLRDHLVGHLRSFPGEVQSSTLPRGFFRRSPNGRCDSPRSTRWSADAVRAGPQIVLHGPQPTHKAVIPVTTPQELHSTCNYSRRAHI